MLRLAAATGLKPAEYFDLTEREFEVWLEGCAEAQDKDMQKWAWVQANLINVQIPRGKPRLTVDKLLPKRARKTAAGESTEQVEATVELLYAKPSERRKMRAAAMKAKQDAEDARRYWASAEGVRLRRSMRSLVDDEESPP